MKEIETSKGKWKLVEIKSIQEGQYYVDTIGSFHYKLSEITEEEASSIVDYSVMNALFYNNYINEGYKGRTWLHSSLYSLHSLLESQGIETTQNTYIFKV